MKTCNYSPTTQSANSHKRIVPSHVQASWMEQRIINFIKTNVQGNHGTLTLTLPSGFITKVGTGSPAADVKLNSLKAFTRLLTGGINGWSESYIEGHWDSSDLTALVRWALNYEKQIEKMAKAGFLTRSINNFQHWRNQNSKAGSRRNIAAHYDLGNDFYKLWLDPGMTYSAALFDSADQSLEDAQTSKNQRILELLQPQQDDHIVEIGCGWGGFAETALQHDLQLHGITLSKEQLDWARNRLADQQLDKKGFLSLTDYRDLTSQYDGVVSIEMFEAVGEKYWDTYFETLKRVLKPGGRAVLQVISIEHQRFLKYRKQADFIQSHIFPGGMLPSIEVLQEKIAEHGFTLQQQQLFGKDYARTLRLWRDKFEQATEQLEELGYDAQFRRLWRYYLSYCEGGFEEGSINVGLYQLCNNNSSL